MSERWSAGRAAEELRRLGYPDLGRAVFVDVGDRHASTADAQRLTARLAEVEAALEPFAEIADRMDRAIRDGSARAGPSPLYAVLDECRAARAALRRGADTG